MEEYYQIADMMQDSYPFNFFIVDAPKFFSDIEYRTDVLSKVDVNIGDEPLLPVNINNLSITTSLHGGLGNNLFPNGRGIVFL